MYTDQPEVTIQVGESRHQVPPAVARSILTPERLQVIDQVQRSDPSSMRELAEGLGRSYSNVHGDVEKLTDAGLLKLETDGRGKQPATSLDNLSPTLSFEDVPEPTPEFKSSHPGSGTIEERAEWISETTDLQTPENLERGDVVWYPQIDGGVPLLILSHGLPDESPKTGVSLTSSPGKEEDQYETISLDDWISGGPDRTTAVIPWELHSVTVEETAGVLGEIKNDRCNDISIATQRYIGPVRR